MVKSRRSASARQSRPKRTLAWRPKVSTSSRSVVTSNGRLSITTVTVPCSMPVGTGLKPAARRRGGSPPAGSAVVAMSNSPIGSPSSALRTAPPTTRASSPSRSSTCEQPRRARLRAARRHLQPSARLAHRVTAPARTCRPRHGPARRSSPAARRRNARDRRSCRSSGPARTMPSAASTFGGQDASGRATPPWSPPDRCA